MSLNATFRKRLTQPTTDMKYGYHNTKIRFQLILKITGTKGNCNENVAMSLTFFKSSVLFGNYSFCHFLMAICVEWVDKPVTMAYILIRMRLEVVTSGVKTRN